MNEKLTVSLYNVTDIYCPLCNHKEEHKELVFTDEIPLAQYWVLANNTDTYRVIFHPLQYGYKTAREITQKLEFGLAKLEMNPEEHNALKGYERFTLFVRDYLAACKENPNAIIEIII